MRVSRKLLYTSVVLYLVSQVFFLINIQFPSKHNFDEFHYVPSAKQFLELKPNQNKEHPPLGKLLMAAGIGAMGDRPIGWRIMSTIFGALTLVGMYILGWIIFGNEITALWIAILTLSNHLLYVQARIGMLDTFMFGFLLWAVTFFCWAWLPETSLRKTKTLFALSGVLFGLALACKWFSIVPWLACCFLFGVVRLFQKWKVQFGRPNSHDWFRPAQWKSLPNSFALVSLILLPVVVYFLTFIPLFFVKGEEHHFLDIFSWQVQMWGAQLRVVNSHPYMSRWLDWPTLHRPIWYAFDHEGVNKEFVRGVFMIGNPLIMWTGLVALLICFWDFVTKRSREAFFVLFFYSVFYFSWPFIPRKVSFYYYYYPAGMFLSFSVAYLFNLREFSKTPWLRWAFLGAACGVFIYFFPILAALKIPAQEFRKWMWFRTWI